MIGDLVLLFDMYPARVEAIGDTEVYLMDDDGVNWKVGYTLIKPIPLTSEILEKNGFEHEWWWRLKGEDFWLCQSGDEWRAYSNEDSDKRDNFCWLSSVHELQHCLRLLKIDKEIVL